MWGYLLVAAQMKDHGRRKFLACLAFILAVQSIHPVAVVFLH